MYVRRTPGPRTVTLPDGTILTMADLPPADTRWVARRKATVVNAVQYGLLDRGTALDRYSLTEEEFDTWTSSVSNFGIEALKVTAIQRFRQL